MDKHFGLIILLFVLKLLMLKAFSITMFYVMRLIWLLSYFNWFIFARWAYVKASMWCQVFKLLHVLYYLSYGACLCCVSVTPYVCSYFIFALFCGFDFRMLHSGIRAGCSIRPYFLHVNCSIVCDTCVYTVDELFLLMSLCWCAG